MSGFSLCVEFLLSWVLKEYWSEISEEWNDLNTKRSKKKDKSLNRIFSHFSHENSLKSETDISTAAVKTIKLEPKVPSNESSNKNIRGLTHVSLVNKSTKKISSLNKAKKKINKFS